MLIYIHTNLRETNNSSNRYILRTTESTHESLQFLLIIHLETWNKHRDVEQLKPVIIADDVLFKADYCLTFTKLNEFKIQSSVDSVKKF